MPCKKLTPGANIGNTQRADFSMLSNCVCCHYYRYGGSGSNVLDPIEYLEFVRSKLKKRCFTAPTAGRVGHTLPLRS